MDPIAAQLLLDELSKLTRKFDEFAVRWDRRFTRPQQPTGGGSPSSCDDDSGAISVDALVTSTNPDASLDASQKLVRCGPADIEYHSASESLRPASEKGVSVPSIVTIGSELSGTDGVAASTDEPRIDSPERIPAARVDAVVVPDNWDGLFEQTAHTVVERDFVLSTDGCIDSVFDRLSLLPDVLLRDIVSRLPIKDAARMAVLSHRWRSLCATPSVSLVRSDPIFPMRYPKVEISATDGFCMDASADEFFCCTTQEGKLTVEREKVQIEVQPFCLDTVEYVLRANPLGGHDGSFLEDPKSVFTYHDMPFARAVGRVGQALAGSAAFRTDAVGAAGGGLLAWVVAAASAQATCSTVCLTGDRNLADIPVSVLWLCEKEMLHWNYDNQVSYMAGLEHCVITVYELLGAAVLLYLTGADPTGCVFVRSRCRTRAEAVPEALRLFLCNAHDRSGSAGLILDPDPRRSGHCLVPQLYPRDLFLHGVFIDINCFLRLAHHTLIGTILGFPDTLPLIQVGLWILSHEMCSLSVSSPVRCSTLGFFQIAYFLSSAAFSFCATFAQEFNISKENLASSRDMVWNCPVGRSRDDKFLKHPWPSFNIVVRFSVRGSCGRLWKPPWPIQIRQPIRFVLTDPALPCKYMMIPVLGAVVICDSVDLRPIPWPSLSPFYEFTVWWCFVFDSGKYIRVIFSVMAIVWISFRAYTSLDPNSVLAIWLSSNLPVVRYSHVTVLPVLSQGIGFKFRMVSAVSACSHVRDHKYAGNIIIFGSNAMGEVFGHWYVRWELLMLDMGFLTTSNGVQSGANCLNLTTSNTRSFPGGESIIYFHDPLLLGATRSLQSDNLFQFVRYITLAIAICRYAHLHEWQQSEAMIWCWNIVPPELFKFKVIWLLPACVLSTYSVQLKRGGLAQFDSLLLSGIWPIKGKHQLLGSSDAAWGQAAFQGEGNVSYMGQCYAYAMGRHMHPLGRHMHPLLQAQVGKRGRSKKG